MLRKILADLGIYGIAPFIPKIASFLVLPLITPFLTKVDFGIYGLILAYITFFKIFYSLGLYVNLTNSFYKSKMQFKWLWRQIYGFLIIWNILFAIVMVGVLYLVFPDNAHDHKWEIILLNVLPIIFFGPTEMIAKKYFHLKREAFQVTIRSAGFGILNIVLTLIFIRYYKMGYMGWFWALFITQILTNISWWFPLNIKERITPIFNFKRNTIRKALQVGLPLIPHRNAAFMLGSSDRVIMDFLRVSTGQIGLYNVAYTGSVLFQTVSDAYTTAVTPHVFELINKQKEALLRTIIFGSQAVFLAGALIFSCFAKEFFLFLFRNEDFNDVYQLAFLIVMAYISAPMYLGANSRFFYYEKTKSLGIQSIIAGITTVIFNLVFIPIYGIFAAAIATFIGYLILTYARYWSKFYKENSILNYYPLYWLLATVLVCVSGFYISALSSNWRILLLGIFILVIFVICYLLKDKILSLFKKY